MKRLVRIAANNVSNQLPSSVDSFLQDIAQMYGGITYSDIMDHQYSDDDIRKLKNASSRFRRWAGNMDDEELDQQVQTVLLPDILSILK